MSTLAVNHEADTEQANQESEEQEPLVSTSVKNNGTSDNGEQRKGDGLGLSKVVLTRLGPVFGDSYEIHTFRSQRSKSRDKGEVELTDERVLIGKLEIEGNKVEEADKCCS